MSMVRLMMILLGVDYLRSRWRPLMMVGWISAIVGMFVFIDVLDTALYFPITPFACLLLEGMATLTVAWTGMGGQRTLRYVKGFAFSIAALLILAGHHHGNFILSMIFGTLFLADGLLQIVSVKCVRYRTWRLAVAGGVVEILLAISTIPNGCAASGTHTGRTRPTTSRTATVRARCRVRSKRQSKARRRACGVAQVAGDRCCAC
jgi:uncharacterized membrane protein HdeD (DUF308 family)